MVAVINSLSCAFAIRIFGLILLVIFVAMECLLVIFNQELSLGKFLEKNESCVIAIAQTTTCLRITS